MKLERVHFKSRGIGAHLSLDRYFERNILLNLNYKLCNKIRSIIYLGCGTQCAVDTRIMK